MFKVVNEGEYVCMIIIDLMACLNGFVVNDRKTIMML